MEKYYQIFLCEVNLSLQENNTDICHYLVWFAAFLIVGLPFTINTHNFTALNVACSITQTINFINPAKIINN